MPDSGNPNPTFTFPNGSTVTWNYPTSGTPRTVTITPASGDPVTVDLDTGKVC